MQTPLPMHNSRSTEIEMRPCLLTSGPTEELN